MHKDWEVEFSFFFYLGIAFVTGIPLWSAWIFGWAQPQTLLLGGIVWQTVVLVGAILAVGFGLQHWLRRMTEMLEKQGENSKLSTEQVEDYGGG